MNQEQSRVIAGIRTAPRFRAAAYRANWMGGLLVCWASLLACSSSSKPQAAAPSVVPPPTSSLPSTPPLPPPPPGNVESPIVKAEPLKPASEMRELFPFVRADLAAKLIELDGIVPIDCHDPRTPRVYLEVTVCSPDSKEHETLAMSRAKPSHVHAALLAAGFTPGSPGSWKWDGKILTAIPPTGDALEVSIAYRNAAGNEIEAPAATWIVNPDTGARFGKGKFIFAGSGMVKRQGREMYDADGSGLLIGLTTFGSECIAWSEVISPEAEVTEPEWIADPKVVPKFGTPVVIRIRPGR